MKRVLIATLALLTYASPALAHVRVTPESADRGSTTTFTFRVPNEEAPAKTVKVELVFPDGANFTTVTPAPVAGWRAATSATGVTWTDGAIANEDAVQFPVTLGPVPAAGDQLVFKVLQTYDNGEVARWIDVPTGTAEPPHPAPVVELTGDAPTTTDAVDSTTTTSPRESDDEGGGSSFGLIMLLIATFFAAVGAGVGIGVWRRRGRSSG